MGGKRKEELACTGGKHQKVYCIIFLFPQYFFGLNPTKNSNISIEYVGASHDRDLSRKHMFVLETELINLAQAHKGRYGQGKMNNTEKNKNNMRRKEQKKDTLQDKVERYWIDQTPVR